MMMLQIRLLFVEALARPSSSFLFCDGMQPRGGVKMRWVILVCHSRPPRNSGVLLLLVRKCELSIHVNLIRINKQAKGWKSVRFLKKIIWRHHALHLNLFWFQLQLTTVYTELYCSWVSCVIHGYSECILVLQSLFSLQLWVIDKLLYKMTERHRHK